jgi:hypothetical protein
LNEIDLTHMSRKVKEVVRAAGLRDELTFTSFRHGGFTEAADSDLTDAEMRAQGGTSPPRCSGGMLADHEAGCGGRPETTSGANRWRTSVRMSSSALVRTAQ